MKSRFVYGAALGLALVAALLVVLTSGAPASAASTPNRLQPVVSYDLRHDTSALLRDLAKLSAPATDRPSAVDAINKRRPNRFDDPKFLLELKERGLDLDTYLASLVQPDGVVQSQIGVPYAPNTMPPTIHNFEGVSQNEMQDAVPGTSDNYIPPDTDGDVGYDPATGKKYYVQYVNTAYAMWDVTNPTPTRLLTATGNALWTGFGGECEINNDGDPIVLFDQLSNRWLMSQFALPGGTAGFHQCIAISQSGDPTGAWHRYDFLLSTTKLNDYPKFGVWPDAYYMSINQFNSSGTAWLGAGALAFERQRMLQGLSAQMVYFDIFSVNADFGGQLPSDWDGTTPPPAGTPNYFAEVDDDGVAPALGPDAMRIWKFHVDWTTPANSTYGVNGTPNYTLTVSPFAQICPTTRSCVPQPGTTSRLDAIGDRVMFRGAYRNINGHETLLLNHSVDAGSSRSGIRWYEVRDVGTAPVIYQQSTYAPADTEHRWMASIAMDHVGNIALGYSVASGTVYPSVRYTGRLASDPLGVMAQGESNIISGTGSQTDSAARWGDYSSMTLDPVDDCTFWYTQEYYAVTSARDWQTRIASFRFPNCSIGPQGAIAGKVTNAANSNPIVGARVDAASNPTMTYVAYANGSGDYTHILPAGVPYTVTGSAYGYLPATFSNVSVVSGTTTTQNIALTVAPTYVISGYVKDSATNDPLMATVAVIGTPFNPPFASVNTDPATGYYSMTLAGGQSYTLTASALLHTAAAQGVTPVSNATVNFNLVATTQNGGIIGYVRNFYTNAPVPNATVTVATGGNPSDQTDANGYFEIFNLVPGTYTATATANLYSPVSISNIQVLSSNIAVRTFLLPTSQLNYNPAALNKTLTFGSVATDTAGLVISNTGIGNLTFGLIEQAGGFAPLMLHQPYAGGPDPFGYTWVSSDEPGGPGYNWIDATGGTALGLADDGEANITLPFSFPFYTSTTTLMRVGNNGAALYNATTGDVGTTNAALADVSTPNYFIAPFWDDVDSDTGDVYWMVTGSAPDRKVIVEWYNRPHYSNVGSAAFELVLFENGDILYQYQDVNFGNASYDNGASATVGIRGPSATYSLQSSYNTASLHDLYAICFDNPNNAGSCGGTGYDAIPWLTETPITGTLAQSALQNIQLGWNAGVAAITQPGTYTATLKIDNNDPVAQSTALPVALTVLPGANQGFLTGVVSTTGVCDVNLAPINGATVVIQGSAGFGITVTTNAAGQYGYWLDAAQSPYTATVSYPDHPTTVVSVGVTGGFTTTQNFTLRLQKPCIATSPNSLSATAQLGSSAPNQTIAVTSSGALPLDFNVFEVPSSLAVGGGPDAYGYTWLTSTYAYIPANDGTALALGDDEEANITLPFSFSFYGASSTSLRIGNNGAVLFNATAGDVSTANAAMSAAPNAFIAPFWDDIDSDTGSVYWKTVGVSPNRKVVIEWYNRPHYSNVGSGTFELVLFENGNIQYQYLDTDFGNALYNFGAGATSGIRGADTANSLQYSFDEAKLNNGLSLCFVRPGNAPCDAVDVPWLTVTPTSTVGLTGTPPSSQLLTVGFNSAPLPLPGTYTAYVLLSHNAPQPAVNIPVTFNVTAPATYGQINGVVNGLAVCDAPGAPLQGADVAITGGTVATATTAANGQYVYFLLGGNAYTLTVSKAGYVSQSTVVTVTAQQTTTTNFNLRLLAPCQSLSTSAFTATQQTNKVTTQTLTVQNTGTTPLVWNIQELAPALLAAPDAEIDSRVSRYIPVANIPLAAPLVNAIQDGSFEATNGTTYANPYWGQDSTTFGTILCNAACATSGSATPRTGLFFAWFGGNATGDVGYIQQTTVLTPGASSLSFYLWMTGNSAAGNFMKVSIDGTPVFTATTANQGSYAAYTLVTVDVTAFANGASRVLRFDSTTTDGGNFFVDDVALDISGPACEPNSLPWVTAVPVSGTVAAGGSANVSLVFNSTALAGGTYSGTLCYASNDPIAPSVQIPVTLKVITEYKLYLPVVRR